MRETPDERRFHDGSAPRPSDARIQKGALRLFRVAGIDVFVHWSWLIIAYFRIQARADPAAGMVTYTSPVWNVVEYLSVFGIVLLHEFGHVLACRSVGGRANKIVLWPLGGVALVEPPPRPGAFLWSLVAGPLVNVILLPPTVGLAALSHFASWGETMPDLAGFLKELAFINAVLLGFNLLPIFPLDGGQILQGLLWFVIGRAHSLMVVTVIGFVTGLGLLFLALLMGALWLGVIAGFAVLASLGGFMRARTLLRMLRARRREEMTCPACGKAPPVGAFWACPRCYQRFDFFQHGGTCPNCSTPHEAAPCLECGRRSPYADWFPGVIALEEPAEEPPQPPQPPAEPAPAPPQRPAPRPASLAARLGCAALLALVAVGVGLANGADRRPIDLVIWGLGGALLGGTVAGPLLRGWKRGRARSKLKGTWRLMEEDGHPADDEAPLSLVLKEGQHLQGGGGPVLRTDDEAPPSLALKGLTFEERADTRLAARGLCWIEPMAEPASITFTAKTGPNKGKPCQGIYRLEGQVLTLCLALPGMSRPTEFVALPGVQRLCVYRRGRPVSHGDSGFSDRDK